MIDKQQINNIIADTLISVSVMGVLYTVFIINHDLANGIVSGKYFGFYTSMALLAVVAVPVAIIKREERSRFILSDLLLLLFCFAAVGITLIHTGRLTSKCLLLIFLMLFYFYLRIFLSGKSGFLCYLLVVFFMFTGLVEAVWGLRQLYGFTYSQHNLFKITGSFFNPGPYSGWLAMVFPMVLWYAIQGFTKKTTTEKFVFNFRKINIKHIFVSIKTTLPVWIKIVIGLLTTICIIFVLPAAMSRASWLAALGGCGVVAFCHGVLDMPSPDKRSVFFRRWRVKPVMTIIIACIAFMFLSAALTGLFLLKKDSASGRAFTWKIAEQTIKEHPIGVGLGNFAGSYGNAQATYFASRVGTEREEYVAAGVEYAFNEYLQICIETGIIPFLIFIAFVGYTLLLGIKNKNYLPVGSLVSLLIFAFMSYPFNILPFVIAFVFLSALCVTGTISDNKRINPFTGLYSKFAVWSFIVVAPMVVALLGIYKVYPSFEAYKQWKQTQILYSMNINKEACSGYEKQYPYLQDEIKFLFEYIHSLSKTEEYEKSNEVLRRATQISCDPMLYNIMGKNYQAMKKYDQSEAAFLKSTHLVPNRLYPWYLLTKLYDEMGLPDKVRETAEIVLTKEPKVQSPAVREMREEVNKLKTKS
jgi:O-antigen ligase